jgi:hypothetical protein
MEAMASFAGLQRDEWIARTFDATDRPDPDPVLLSELRTRADAYRAIPETTYDDWMSAHGHDPQPE